MLTLSMPRTSAHGRGFFREHNDLTGLDVGEARTRELKRPS
jgi:hypothetical protein